MEFLPTLLYYLGTYLNKGDINEEFYYLTEEYVER